MYVLINSMGESIHNVYIYQIIMLYTLNILELCQLHFNKPETKDSRLLKL